jgi:tRNA(His) 5'-end guanylyltransferase
MQSLGDRMKDYEKAYKYTLPKRLPIVVRLDGKAFLTFTKGLKKPYSETFMDLMNSTTKYLCEQIQGVVMAYTQSDEISLLLHNYKRFNSEGWFSNNIQKIVSVSAGLASSYFTQLYTRQSIQEEKENIKIPVFDSRVFIIPENDVNNYFVWRQQDWIRNSIQMLARSMYSEKECYRKDQIEMRTMALVKGKNWEDLNNHIKYGRITEKQFIEMPNYIRTSWNVKKDTILFQENPNYIKELLEVEEG